MGKNFISEKPFFFRAKNATVSTWRSGTDYCWLYCELVVLKMIKWKLLKNIVLVNNQSLAVTKGESFYRSVKGCQTVARFFFSSNESCFGNIRRGSFILEAEKHIKPICFRNF